MKATMAERRVAVDPDDLREYDRFGPWIDHIGEPVDMPRRFRPWWPELGGARYLLKIPRPYDRAQIHPGMDLYASVVAVFADRLCILRAEPNEIVRTDLRRDDIVGSVLHTNLLIGRWTSLLADGGRVDVEFNSASHALINEVERYVMSSDSVPVPTTAPQPEVRPGEHLFTSAIIALNAGEQQRFRPVHVEEPGRPCRSERGWRRRSAGMMLLLSANDLAIVNRDLAMQPLLRVPTYAYNVIRVPLRRITSFEVRSAAPSEPPRFSQLVLHCRDQEIVQPCLDRPDAVAALLDERGVGAAA